MRIKAGAFIREIGAGALQFRSNAGVLEREGENVFARFLFAVSSEAISLLDGD